MVNKDWQELKDKFPITKVVPIYHSKSDIHGTGVFVKVDVNTGDFIGVSHAFYRGCFYMTTHGYYNHSYNPNCVIESEGNLLFIIADKEIKAKEELTVDYTKQPYLEQPKEDWK